MRASTWLRGWGVALLGLAGCQGGAGDDELGTSEGASSDGVTASESGTSESGTSESGTSESSTSESSSEGVPDPLVAEAGPDQYAIVGESAAFDASGSSGAVLYQWDFGDGTPPVEPSAEPFASHEYDAPGRYYPVLTVWDEQGNSLADSLTITATFEPTFTPRHAATIVAIDALGQPGVALVSTDSDELVIVGAGGTVEAPSFEVLDRFATCDAPRSVALVYETRLVVTCQASDEIMLFDLDGPLVTLPLPRGSRPFAAVVQDDVLLVSLAATGELARFDSANIPPTPLPSLPAVPDARGLAPWPDGRVALTRWRSPDQQGELALIDPHTGALELVALAYDPTPPSDTEIGGVPSYLEQVLVSPIGNEAAIPSIQANFAHGEFLTGETLTFETTIRAVVSFVELAPAGQLLSGQENFDRRKQFDNRGFAQAGVYTSHGDYLFVVMPGNRSVERYDVLTGAQAGSLLDVGYAPKGVALSPDDRFLYVDASLDRELRIYDVSSFDLPPAQIEALVIPSAEPLAPEVLRGKQLFNDSADARLSKHGYVACAHCHLDGEADLRTWDFTDRGEGLRNTISLLGRGGTAHGPIHWSANFDEVQDFEHDLRGPFGGTGLLDDADWQTGTVSTTLGDPKAGLSSDLDALAAYVTSLDAMPRSPHRNQDGTLSAAAQAGQALFESPQLGCTSCHVGPRLSDSSWIMPAQPLLHDVGTLGPGSGQRLGGPLDGIDTPTLFELWNSAPYLHDGSAPDLASVLTSENPSDLHGATSQLSAQQLEQLIAYLLALE